MGFSYYSFVSFVLIIKESFLPDLLILFLPDASLRAYGSEHRRQRGS